MVRWASHFLSSRPGRAAPSVLDLLPRGPVLGRRERNALVQGERASGARYTGAATRLMPVLPLLVFGARYDLDVVVVSTHPRFEMHEYAALDTPDGRVWLAKDTRAGTGDQSLLSAMPDLFSELPEIPLPRKRTPLEVIDRSAGGRIDLRLRYVNIDGEPVDVRYEGPSPRPRRAMRNGSVMGHGRDQVLAVLDLSHAAFGRRVQIAIGGRARPLRRILGVLPFGMALTQVQAGFAEATLRQLPNEQGFSTVHAVRALGERDREVTLAWTVKREGRFSVARQVGRLRTLVYTFLEAEGGARELLRAEVFQPGSPIPPLRVTFAPALPDLGRPFEGNCASRYVLDVNGREGHGVGRLVVRRRGAEVQLEAHPEAPWWTTNRRLTGRIRLTAEGAAELETVVTPSPARRR